MENLKRRFLQTCKVKGIYKQLEKNSSDVFYKEYLYTQAYQFT